MANSNMKATVDFAGNSGTVDILADRLYIARDRTLIASNQTPNIQGDLLIGKGNVDVNTAVLGFQEHNGKTDWTTLYGADPYLNYCQGRLIVTNGGTFKINGTLTLGYTADTNPVGSAQQYNTFGRVTVYAGSTVIASNIVCDTGLNFYDVNKRQNTITLDAGTLVVTNFIGGSSANANVAGNLAGLPLDTLTMRNGATLTLFVTPGRTNVYVRTLTCEGSTPDTIKIGSLVTTGLSYPTNLPIISYGTATPLLQANMTNVTGVQGYILNDAGNKLITLYLTTNAPKTLLWTGSADNNWDLNTKNWVPVGGGVATNFALGDIVTFDDTSVVTNISVAEVVTPGQMTVSNVARQYTFTANNGAIAGTAQLVKMGANTLAINVSDGQTVLLKEGTVTGSGSIGGAVIYSNGVPNVLDFSGAINGSVASTNAIVTLEVGSSINSGTVTINGGVFVNAGTVTLPFSGTFKFVLTNNVVATNTADGIIYLGPGNPAAVVYNDCTLANFGMINTYGSGSAGGRLLVYGLYFGTGTIYDPLGGTSSNSGRLAEQDTLDAVISPGATPSGSIGNMNVFVRFDLRANNNSSNPDGKLLIEVDQAGTVNDTITCDKWNNLGNIWVMTNLDNASFSAGQIFHVLKNSADGFPNTADTGLSYPLMWPPVPGPGLQWNISRLQTWGDVMVTNSAMIWDGGNGGSWDTNGTTGNWKNSQTYADWQGAVFDERASAFNVHVTTTVAPAGFNVVNITNVTYSTNIVGTTTNITMTSSNKIVTTNFPSFMPGIVVSNSTDEYVMDGTIGKISGMAGIYKTGPGTLTMLIVSNDFTGGVIVDGGTLAITNKAALGATAGGAAYQQMILNDCTLKFFGVANTNEGYNLVTINEKGATVEVSSNAAVFRMDSTIQGPGALTKTGLGTLGLGNGKVNVYKGGTTLSEGTLQLMGDGAAGVGANLNIANGTVLQLTNKSSVNITNTINFAGDALVQEINPTRFITGGKWIGSGTVTISNAAGDSFFFSGGLTNYSGVISLGNSSGSYLFNNSTNKSPCLGSALATFDLGTSTATLSNFNGGALTYDLGGLAGGAGTILAGRATNNVTTNAATTYSIGANGSNTTFSGKIVNGVDDVVTVVKVGSGRLLLNGANTYTGGTTVSNGILGGTGSIVGALTVVSGATLAPGATIGTFTVGGTATLAGVVVLELNRTNSPATNDMLVVTGTITAPGALVVTNVGPDIYNGSTFKLFSQGITFGSVQLPAKDPTGTKNYVWDQSNLPVNGTITLTSGGANPVNPNPTNIIFSVSGSALTLSWPEDHIGWQLWSNSVGLLNTDMWFQIAGSAATNQMIFTLDPTKSNVFFRLMLP
jgi:autotransporter-associated beta strand protein